MGELCVLVSLLCYIFIVVAAELVHCKTCLHEECEKNYFAAMCYYLYYVDLILEPLPRQTIKRMPQATPRRQQSVPVQRSQTQKLLVSNIMDFDEETLYFWIKTVLGVWPSSIQKSGDEEKAIIKLSGDVGKHIFF